MRTITQTLYRRRYALCYAAIACVAVFMRFYRLTGVPVGLHVDEASMAYDAFCLSEYGVTRDLLSYPVYLMNYTTGQNALSSYLAMACFKVLGPTVFAARLPGALFSLLTVFLGGRIIRQGLGRRAALVGTALLAVMPYFVISARFGLESYLLSGTSTLFLYVFVTAIKKQRWWLFALAGAAAGLTLYSYAVAYILMPMFLVLAAVWLLYAKQAKLPHLAVTAGAAAVVGAPLIAFVFINMLGLPGFTIGKITIPGLPAFRSGEISFANIPANIQAMVDVLFFRDPLPYNAFDLHYTLFLVSIPFALVGLWAGVKALLADLKAKTCGVTGLMLLFFCCAAFYGLLLGGGGPNVNKVNAAYFPLAYFVVAGLKTCWEKAKNQKRFAVVVAGLYAASALAFGVYYFAVYPVQHYRQEMFCPDPTPVVEYLPTLQQQEPRRVFFTDNIGSVFYAWAAKASPYEMGFGLSGESIGMLDESVMFFFPPDMGWPMDTAYYVIPDWAAHQIAELEQAGFEILYHDADYRVYG